MPVIVFISISLAPLEIGAWLLRKVHSAPAMNDLHGAADSIEYLRISFRAFVSSRGTRMNFRHPLAIVAVVALTAIALPAAAAESVGEAASNAATKTGHAIGEAGRATGHAVAETGRKAKAVAKKGVRKAKAAGHAASATQ
ncbi:MAG: hypothetical protein ABI460_04095 [Caldimonas sp.]